jgi:two-component system phosphate regulon response regulator PhoB
MSVDTPSILIVEDEPSIATLLVFTLRYAGWNPCAVANAFEAWQFLQKHTPALALLDWMLPDRTGLSLLMDIRREPKLEVMPVIMLTAKSMSEDRALCLERGANAYVTKPFSPRELTFKIDQLLPHKPIRPCSICPEISEFCAE